MTIELTVNGKARRVEADPAMPLLWVLRDLLDLTGSKYACGRGLCGACTVHVGGKAVQSCMLPVAAVGQQPVTTIEGLGEAYPDRLHPVQSAWIEADVAQCGFCITGQIMQAASLLRDKPDPSTEDIDRAMSGVLCRCGTYPRTREAIKLAARQLRDQGAAG